MAGRGPQSFKKRQKEQQRKEKQQEKLARKAERKRQILAGEVPPEEDPADEYSFAEDEDLSHIPGIVD